MKLLQLLLFLFTFQLAVGKFRGAAEDSASVSTNVADPAFTNSLLPDDEKNNRLEYEASNVEQANNFRGSNRELFRVESQRRKLGKSSKSSKSDKKSKKDNCRDGYGSRPMYKINPGDDDDDVSFMILQNWDSWFSLVSTRDSFPDQFRITLLVLACL
jgi:hypothetical protein